MGMASARWGPAALVLLLTAAACSGEGAAIAADQGYNARSRVTTTTASTTTTVVTTTTAAPPPTTVAPLPAAPVATVPATTSSTRPHPARAVVRQVWVPYATAGPVTLHHPSDRVEAIGFHQSAHDGAQHQTAGASAVRWFTMGSRDRDTESQGAADVVIEPGYEIRAPVTGTVIRGGTYTLYCDHVDQYVVIEPDARPGWEVKVLHIQGLAVRKGDHVEAGVTPLAANARVLPFPSQVEDDTGLPAWPHVHIEVVDPTIPDRPTGPGCD